MERVRMGRRGRARLETLRRQGAGEGELERKSSLDSGNIPKSR